MVSALDLRSKGRWCEHGLCPDVVSSVKKLCCTFPLIIQVYKWVRVIIMLGGGGGRVTLRWTSIPSRRNRNISNLFMLPKLELSTVLVDNLARKHTAPSWHYGKVGHYDKAALSRLAHDGTL